MAEQEFKFLVSFDVQTGNLSVAKANLENMGQAAQEAGRKSEGMKNAFSGIGELAKTVSIGAFLFDAAKTALASSDAMDDLNNEWKKTIGILVRDLAPALDMISKGLQGTLIMVQAFGDVLVNNSKLSIQILQDLVGAIFNVAKGFYELITFDWTGFKKGMSEAAGDVGKARRTRSPSQ
jgi:hypothetical protein